MPSDDHAKAAREHGIDLVETMRAPETRTRWIDISRDEIARGFELLPNSGSERGPSTDEFQWRTRMPATLALQSPFDGRRWVPAPGRASTRP